MPVTQADIVQELYNRVDTLPADKAAVVSELARRMNLQRIPDAAAQSRASALSGLNANMGDTSQATPVHPWGGAPLVDVNPDEVLATVPQNAPAQIAASMVLGPRVGPRQAYQGVSQIANAHSADDVVGGAHQVLSGAMQTAAPTLGAAVIAAPGSTALGLVAGDLAGKGAHAGLKFSGASDNVADLGSDVAGLVAGGAAGHGYGKITEPIRDFGLPFMLPAEDGRGIASLPINLAAGVVAKGLGGNLDPAEAAAVQYGRDNGVHMPASTQTGSKVALGGEKLLEHVPFGPSRIAEDSKAQSRSTLAAAGQNELAGLNPDAPTVAKPLDAGEAIAQHALDKEKGHSEAADNAYDLFRSIEAQPKFAAEVQTGTRRVLDSAKVDEQGNPVYKTEPVTETIASPVDRRPAKLALKPLLDRMLRLTPLAQEQSSIGIKALRNIVEGPDFESASVTDEDLGAIKGILREKTSDRSRGLANFAVDQLSKAVDAAAERMGPDAVEALKRGREETVNKYTTQDYQKALGFKNVGTPGADLASPVGLVEKLSAEGDRNVKLLRQVAENAPEHIPALAQAVAQGLVDKVTANAGMDAAQSALRAHMNLGAETKQILFGDKSQNIQNFLTLAKRLAENPNRSGTGPMIAIMKAGGLAISSPVTGAASLVGSRALARMLFNPDASRLMTTALRTSADARGASLLGSQLAKAAAAAGATASPAAAGAAAPAASPDTFVTVPGEPGNTYRGQYKVVERSTLNASHSGKNFNPNPNYPLKNDRDYTTATNQGPVIGWSSRGEFDPKQLINDNPTAENGAIVADSKGNVLGGNGRAMILERVFSDKNHPGIEAYKKLLAQKAAQFGIDPASLEGMHEPVLVREIADSEFAGRTKQDAISDFNKSGVKSLTPSEEAIRDSNRVSAGTLEHIAGRLEAHGADATVSDILDGQHGKDVLDRLIKDGVVTTQERGKYENDEGLTPDGRDRISALIAGRFFRDPKMLDSIAPTVRNQVARIAAPLAQVQGRGDWNLTPDMQDAVEILHRAQANGVKNVDDFIKTDGLFGDQKYSANAQTLARAIKTLPAKELVSAARQYASDANHAAGGASLFGAAPMPESSFADSFEAAIKAKRETPKNALAQVKSAKPANALAQVNGKDKAPVAVASAAEETGPHGPIYREFTNRPAEAIDKLITERRGEVPGVWKHPKLGPIDLAWGNKKGGMQHILEKHIEGRRDLKVEDLARMIPEMEIDPARSDARSATLVSPSHRAAVRLDFDGKTKHWLVTAFEQP